MKESKQEIAELLKADTTLTALLADGTDSVIPAGSMVGRANTPFITIQGGQEIEAGNMLVIGSVYIRAYNDASKTYVDIDQIVERVRTVLNEATLGLTSDVFVRLRWEFTTQEVTDDELKLNFKEVRLRILML